MAKAEHKTFSAPDETALSSGAGRDRPVAGSDIGRSPRARIVESRAARRHRPVRHRIPVQVPAR